MAPTSWVAIAMVMPWYLWLVFTGIVGQEQDDLAISDTEDKTKMDSLRIQHNSNDQNQKSSRIKMPRRGVPAKGRGLPTSRPSKTQGLSPYWSLQLS